VNLAETHDLLTFVAAYDNRRFGDETVLAWQPIFADLPFGDCRAAVTRHFATSTDYLMPAHIVWGAEAVDHERRQATRTEREAAAMVELEADPTRYDRLPETRALLRELRDRLPSPGRDILRLAEWVEHDKRVARAAWAEPNPHYVGPPPVGGWPLPIDAKESPDAA
jgi:hypothetical protein